MFDPINSLINSLFGFTFNSQIPWFDEPYFKMLSGMYSCEGMQQSEEAKIYNIRGSINIEKSRGIWVWEDIQ